MLNACVVFPNRLDQGCYGEKRYNYLTHIGNLKEGDLVVVETQYGYAVAKFVKYMKKPKDIVPTAHIVQKVDLEAFEAEKARYERIKEIEVLIEHRLEQANKRKLFEQLAEQDEVMKDLLEELDKLQKAEAVGFYD